MGRLRIAAWQNQTINLKAIRLLGWLCDYNCARKFDQFSHDFPHVLLGCNRSLVCMNSRILISLSIITFLLSGPFTSRVSAASSTSLPEGARLLLSDDSGITLQFSTPNYSLESEFLGGQEFQKLVVPNAEMSVEVGKPQLPVVSVLLGVPADVQVDLHVLEDDARTLQLDFSLPSVPEREPGASPLGPESSSGAIPAQYELRNSEAFTSKLSTFDLYPAAAVSIIGDAWLRDQRIIRVQFHPFQVEPGGTSLRWHRSLQVELAFSHIASASNPVAEDQASINPFEGALQANLLNYETARSWRVSPQSAAVPLPNSVLSSNAASTPRYKIVVDHDGLYRLTYADLENAGMLVDSVDPETFHLTSQGEDVSIYVSGEGDGSFDPDDFIEFYGRKFHGDHLAQLYSAENQNWLTDFIFYSDSTYIHWTPEFNATMMEKYTDENVYWLTVGDIAGPRMASVSGTPGSEAQVPTSYRTTVRAEQSHEWWTWHFTSEDSWFWDTIAPNISTPIVTNTYTTTLSAVAVDGLPADVHAESVAYFFNSYYPDDHHTLFYLNDGTQPLEDAVWDGHTRHTFDAQVPASDLLEGINSLRFVAEKTQHMTSDRIYFDWFSIEYSRQFLAEDNQIFFSYDEAGSDIKYVINGFSDSSAEILDISDDFAPIRILISPPISGGTVSFGAKHPAVTSYLLAGESAVQTPKSISYDAPPDLLASTNAADYIIISHADFITAAQKLADYRASQGMRTMIVDVQDLYDEFNFGIYNPIAIKNFLAYTFTHWQTAPAYVVLVGSGHWNLKDYQGGSSDYWSKPVYMPPNLAWVDPWQGETDSANLLAAVVGNDILPDLFIGRIPVDTVDQLNAVINKTIAYESSPYQDWQKRMMFVADNTDPYAGDFIQFSNAVISDHVPLDYTPNRIYLDENIGCASDISTWCSQATYEITSTLNLTGSLIVNYVGHGADSRWASESVLRTTADPVKQFDSKYNHLLTLDNGARLPVVLSMTCLDGYWIHTLPDKISLAVELLRSENKGAVATFSPTGLGVATGHDVINGAFFDALFKDGVWRLGPATLAGKLALYGTGRNLDLINTFTIFGDPALHILSPYGVQITPQNTSRGGDPGSTVTYNLELENTGGSVDTYDVSTSGNQWVVSAPVSVGPVSVGGNANVQVSITIPSDVPIGSTDAVKLNFTSRGDTDKSTTANLTTISQHTSYLFLPLIR
jgi:hemin uptake protein HemP